MSSTLTRESEALVLEAIGSNLPAAADAFRLCFEFDECGLEVGEPVPLDESEMDGFDGPGLLLKIDVGNDRVLALIPASLLPAWASEPDKSQSARLQTLPVEWSYVLLPPEFEPGSTSSSFVENLWLEVSGAAPKEWATRVDLAVQLTNGDDGLIRLVWPFTQTQEEMADAEAGGEAETGAEVGTSAGDGASNMASAAPPAAAGGAATRSPLAGIVVPLSVRLAEKRIDIQQFVELTPGALVPFDRNCEIPLELYVANQRFAVGEAVKIGERFGLKIDAIGSDPP